MPHSLRDAEFRAEALPCFDDVARYALSLTQNRDEAEDLTQETYLRAFRAWHQYTPGTECRRWLFTICRHHFVRGRERAKRVASYEDPEVEALAASSVHASAVQAGWSDIFERVDLADAITTALAGLPEPFREAVVNVDHLDLSYEAAADLLGVPIGTVRSRLFRREAPAAGTAADLCQGRRPDDETARLTGGGIMMPMDGMLDCNAVIRQLWDYLDAELTPERMEQIRAHLAVCQRCFPQYQFERSFLDVLASTRSDHPAIGQLRDRVLAALKGEGLTGT